MEKLEAVRDIIKKKLSARRDLHEHFKLLDLETLAGEFYTRAPHYFLAETEAEELAALCVEAVDSASAVYEKLSRSSNRKECRDSIGISQGGDSEHSALSIAMPDCPFIVNTISECLAEKAIHALVFIHPIIRYGTQRFSCSYLRLPKLDAGAEEALIKEIRESLADLLIITSDYPEVKSQMQTLTDTLLGGLDGTPDADYETPQFLDWLLDDNFVFIGLRKYTFTDSKKGPENDVQLGLFRSTRSASAQLLAESTFDGAALLQKKGPILVSRLRTKSPVHRRVPLVNITVRAHGDDSKKKAVYSITGLLTSKARAQESSDVPLVRRKLQSILTLEDVAFNSHDYKYVVDIVDNMPKDEALRLEVEALRENIHIILEMQHLTEVRASYRYDEARRGVSALVLMPRERFNSQVRQKIQQRVEELFGAERGSSEYHLNYSNKPLVRFYFYIPLPENPPAPPSVEELQSEISDQARSWSDNFSQRVFEHFPEDQHAAILRRYGRCFSAEYQAIYSVDAALTDVIECEQIARAKPIHVALFDRPQKDNPNYVLSVYSVEHHITVSRALPILDNMGLDVINETSSLLTTPERRIFIHRFSVQIKSGAELEDAHFNAMVAPALAEIFLGEGETDSLNALIIDARLTARTVALLRVYCGLLWQITKFASRQAIFDSLTAHPDITRSFWQLFSLRFDPSVSLTIEERAEQYQTRIDEFKDDLRQVTDITKDRILRGLASLLSASIRTNFYQNTDRIAIKFRSREVDLMPNPKPLFEIFIRSKLTEGVHLRNGPVSRGGIRWSDRVEDFRSEVLGLMATQTMKNVLIVPDGAKGGFIVRQMPRTASEVPAAVQNGYRDFIRAILSISDNRSGEQVQKPPHVVCWDSDDPYLVVAADKGTATFSDTANEIAVDEFKFWLNDAFASGGSFGYDHKKYGITAKGAWESARRHFSDMNYDFEREPFTAIGIGDMSGDVFGNGMLLSKTIKLIAAFDHRHVFIDPDPDPERAFNERKRLFALPRSQWTDYDRSIMSAGAGIFGRYEKEVTLSEQARAALGIDASAPRTMSGEEVIALVLKAPVDLFFKCGIGSYV